MNNREPQVGDVYKMRHYGGYRLGHITMVEDNKKYIYIKPFGSSDTQYGRITSHSIKEYMGKLAPRHKRLLGIYYIKDKSND